MNSDKVVTTADVLESIRRVRRVGRQRIVRELEQREPDLTEHLLEELTLIHQKLAELGPNSRQLRRIYQRMESLAIVLVSALELAQGRMWMEFILTIKPYKTRPVAAPADGPPAVVDVADAASSGHLPFLAAVSSPTPPADPVAEFLMQRRVILAMAGGRLMAHPEPAGPRFDPFPLPRLPITLIHWCQTVCRLHFKRTWTRMIVLLMLDRTTGWWRPVIPTQVSTRRQARLVLSTADLSGFAPSYLIAGSFQTTGSPHLPMALSAVPKLDGLHVVRHICSTWAFVRAGEETTLADPATVTVDDLRQTLDTAAGRVAVR